MQVEEAYFKYMNSKPWPESSVAAREAFRAGWFAAESFSEKEATVDPTGPIFIGTMEGVAQYLEARDRLAYMAMRRAYEANGWTTKTAQRYAIEYLQIKWCNIGDAWRIAQKLVTLEPEKPMSESRNTALGSFSRSEFQHTGCKHCVFLGRWARDGGRDLYFCPKGGGTVLSRWGNGPSEYSSGWGSPAEDLREAMKRAIDRGLKVD